MCISQVDIYGNVVDAISSGGRGTKTETNFFLSSFECVRFVHIARVQHRYILAYIHKSDMSTLNIN